MQYRNKNRNWIAIGALIVSIISLAYTIISSHIQTNRIQEAEFTTQALQNRPMLSIVGKPEVRKVKYTTKLDMADSAVGTKFIKKINTKLTIDTNIKIRNDGNSNAHLIFYAMTDRLSGLPEIRNITCNRFDKFSGRLIVDDIDDYYQTIDILPGKEHTLAVSTQVENVNEGVFNIHYYLVYKNDAGNVFDTYYWARFKSKEFSLNPAADSDTIGKILMNSIVFVDDHSSYKVFNKEESFYLSNLRESLKKDSNKK